MRKISIHPKNDIMQLVISALTNRGYKSGEDFIVMTINPSDATENKYVAGIMIPSAEWVKRGGKLYLAENNTVSPSEEEE